MKKALEELGKALGDLVEELSAKSVGRTLVIVIVFRSDNK